MTMKENIARIELSPEYLAEQGLSPTFAARFFNKFRKADGCWNWLANKCNGYGQLSRGRKMPPISAHRVSWIIYRGPIPEGMWVLHQCDNRACVNPDHLFLGTAQDNTNDMMKKGRDGHGCCYGETAYNHKLTEDVVLQIRSSVGVKQRDLAKRFGVCQRVIFDIIHRKIWRHI